MIELRLEIFGRVQGVRFRHFVKQEADRLNVKGIVKNRSEGSVLIIGQGERKEMDAFLHNVQRGPRLSKVEGVSYTWKDIGEKYNDFKIEIDKGLIKDQKSSFMNLGRRVLGIREEIPKHVAIIPDGNRRWAKSKGMKGSEGHKKASEKTNVISLLDKARDIGVKYLTFWAFSTENWKRDSKELSVIFKAVLSVLKELREEGMKNEVRFRHLGRRDRIPQELLKYIEKLEKDTEKFDKFNVQICLDYGGRDEIARAMNKLLKSGLQEIKEDDIENYLDSKGIPDPDLIVRTSGEKRMSGFMGFQGAYAEFYFTDLHFPDFGPEELEEAVVEFGARRRRFGGG